jgi:hypothetical protein
MPRLRICDECSRHVLVEEVRCPFCEAELSSAPREPEIKLPAGLSRAQRFAMAAVVVGQAATAGCTETVSVPVYGAPFTDAGSGKSGSGGAAAGRDGAAAVSGNVAVPVYGAPFVPAGSGGSGGAASAGSGGEQVSFPVYGAPFVDAGVKDDDAGEP